MTSQWRHFLLIGPTSGDAPSADWDPHELKRAFEGAVQSAMSPTRAPRAKFDGLTVVGIPLAGTQRTMNCVMQVQWSDEDLLWKSGLFLAAERRFSDKLDESLREQHLYVLRSVYTTQHWLTRARFSQLFWEEVLHIPER